MSLRTIDLCPYAYTCRPTGKLIEKVVLKRLLEYMSQHGLNEPLQSAYRPRHSTETALMKVQHYISKDLDENRGVALVLLVLHSTLSIPEVSSPFFNST